MIWNSLVLGGKGDVGMVWRQLREMRVQVQIPLEAVGLRLDRFVLEHCPSLSHARLCRLIRKRTVRVAGRTIASIQYRLASDDRNLSLPAVAAAAPRILRPRTESSSDIDLRSLVIYEDDHCVAINKPSGVAVQGGSGIRLSIDSLLWQLDNPHIRIVHRLDLGCSGALLLAKSRPIARTLATAFATKRAQKLYLALVGRRLRVDPQWTTMSLDLIRATNHHGWELTVPSSYRGDFNDAQKAVRSETKWRCVESCSNYSLLEMMPITGRKHQLRSFCAFVLGAPIIGDDKYGGADADRLMLHCKTIHIADPNHITISALIPPEFTFQYDRLTR